MAQTRDEIQDLSPADIVGVLQKGYAQETSELEIVSGELATVAKVRSGQSYFAVKSLPGSQADGQLVKWQAEAMQLLQSNNLPVPEVLRTTSGELVYESKLGEQKVFTIVNNWVDAPSLAQVNASPALLTGVGKLAGQISVALNDFPLPPVPVQHEWEFARAGETLRQFLPRIPDPQIKEVATMLASLHDDLVQPLLATLEHQVLHQDLHDSNLLIGSYENGEQFVAGILDFGDMVEGPRIGEIIVAAAYAARNFPEPVIGVIHALAGWNSLRPITLDERKVIWVGVVSRLALNLSIWSARSTGPRGGYAISRSQGTMQTLEKLLAIDPAEFEAKLNSALA